MPHGRKGALELGQQGPLGAALENFRNKGAARTQQCGGEGEGILGQRDDA